MDSLTAINPRQTPQSQRADARQIPNAAGGYAFKIDDDARIHRFLTLGVSGGTYYTTEKDLTKDNAEVVLANAAGRGQWLVEQVVAISEAGRAPRQNPAIFALAACAALSDDDGRRAAMAALPAVCRTGYTLFLFARYIQQFRGWGGGLRRGVANWYLGQDVNALAYQCLKYRQREGWSHAALLRLAHPKTDDPALRALFNWIINGDVVTSRSDSGTNVRPAEGWPAPETFTRAVGATAENLLALVAAFEQAQASTEVATWRALIEAYPLSWEMLPDIAMNEPGVWQALIAKGLPQTALMRQLPRLTNLGVLAGGDSLATVVAQLQDPDRLREGRVHPINILIALKTYAGGHSIKGSTTWTPKRQVIDALDAAFYAAYAAVEPADKRTLLALDISGSMNSPAGGLPITCREVTAALSLVTVATEPNCDVVGFIAKTGRSTWSNWRENTELTELAISPRQRLDDVVRSISNLPMGGTDCALPMTWALEKGRRYETIAIMTDNETWAGNIHPHQALARYRQKTGIATKFVVLAMTATEVSIADPADRGSLDIAGMDSNVPNLISDFSAGRV